MFCCILSQEFVKIALMGVFLWLVELLQMYSSCRRIIPSSSTRQWRYLDVRSQKSFLPPTHALGWWELILEMQQPYVCSMCYYIYVYLLDMCFSIILYICNIYFSKDFFSVKCTERSIVQYTQCLCIYDY